MIDHGVVAMVAKLCVFLAALSPVSGSTTAFHTRNRNGGRFWSTRLCCANDELLTLDEANVVVLPNGIPNGFFVVKQYPGQSRFDHSMLSTAGMLSCNQIKRLGLTEENSTLPVALMLLDPQQYPTLSRARKGCRQGIILLHRGSMEPNNSTFDDQAKCSRGRVGDRIYPGDVIAVQERMSHGSYSSFVSCAEPTFDLPVVYQDDHFAIVNKPAGILVYRDANKGRGNVKFALPYVLTPPRSEAVEGILRRPQPVHRLDRPTSGLLIVGKTQQALVHLARQFEDRIVNKTYTAIVNGSLSVYETDSKVDGEFSAGRWQLAHNILEGKEAVTLWRSLGTYKSLKAKDQCLTLVELKPKTGRYHQLRRQLAWIYDTPIIGDPIYGATRNYEAKRWYRGLMLCSNRVSLLHPFYNTPAGRDEWEKLSDDAKYSNGVLEETKDGEVLASVSIDLPSKFKKFLQGEEKRASYAS